MLRASSLGLRCYLQTLATSSLPCRRFTPAIRVAWNTTHAHQSLLDRPEHDVGGSVENADGSCTQAQKLVQRLDHEVGDGAEEVEEAREVMETKSNVHPLPLRKGRYKRLPMDIAKKFPEDPTTGLRTARHPGDVPPSATRGELLYVIATTSSVDAALQAYSQLSTIPADKKEYTIPAAHLHRLARLIASSRRRTRNLFVHLLSVLATLHKTGGRIQLWEWNALIDFAGKGWRKTRQEDYQTAFNVYCDLASGNAPGFSFSRQVEGVEQPPHLDRIRFNTEPEPEPTDTLVPDIVTYTTLLNIAGRTRHEPSVRKANALLRSSGLKPNRITLLSMMNYHCRKDDLANVRLLWYQIQQSGFEPGIAGVNSLLFTYNRLGRRDVAGAIYTVLKYAATVDTVPEHREQTQMALDYLQATEGIYVPSERPDKITYIGLVQSYAYHGYFFDAIQTFIDMVQSLSNVSDKQSITWLMPAYRAIFCGFVRHGQAPDMNEDSSEGGWTLKALSPFFHDFLNLPGEAVPSARMLYWILSAFDKCSGHDPEVVADAYVRLVRRFGGGWGGRLKALGLKLSLIEEE